MDPILGIIIGILFIVGGGWLIVRHNNHSKVRVKPESNTPRPKVEPAPQPAHQDIRMGRDRPEYKSSQTYSASEYNRMKSDEEDVQRRRREEDQRSSDFNTSMALGMATGIPIGPDMSGAVVGAMMHEAMESSSHVDITPDPTPSYDASPSYDSSPSIDSSPSMDFGSSCDSISSCDSTSFSCDSSSF